MKVFIYGECDQYGSGAWCYHETLKELGHDVAYYSTEQLLERHWSRYNRSTPYKLAMRFFDCRMPEFERRRHIGGLVESVRDFAPDIFIVLKGVCLDKDSLCRLKAGGAWAALINHDDFFSRYGANRSKMQRDTVAHYDFVFPTKEVNVKELRHVNPNVEFFAFAYYPRIHRPPIPNDEDKKTWQTDAVFVGSCYPERTKQLEYLASKLPINLKIYGQNWGKVARRSPLRNCIQGRGLGPDDMAKALFYSKVSLGFLCKENRDDYTQRTFEVPACKGVLLAERTPRHAQFYQEGIEVELFESSNYAEMVTKVEYLLREDQYREAIRERGHEAVLARRHTYADRLSRLIELYKQRRPLA